MYHPAEGFPEYLEIINTSKTSAVLDGFRFTDGISFYFKAGTQLLPGEGIVLTNDTLLFRNKYGFRAFGQYNKQLENSGEIIILQNSCSQTVDSVAYFDSVPWPMNADGTGLSIEIVNSGADNSVANNWRTSSIFNGTPYRKKLTESQEVVLYPNPFSETVFVDLLNYDYANKSFKTEVYNLTGTLVKSVVCQSNGTVIKIPMHDVTQGVYLFRISPSNDSAIETITRKAVKSGW